MRWEETKDEEGREGERRQYKMCGFVTVNLRHARPCIFETSCVPPGFLYGNL